MSDILEERMVVKDGMLVKEITLRKRRERKKIYNQTKLSFTRCPLYGEHRVARLCLGKKCPYTRECKVEDRSYV